MLLAGHDQLDGGLPTVCLWGDYLRDASVMESTGQEHVIDVFVHPIRMRERLFASYLETPHQWFSNSLRKSRER